MVTTEMEASLESMQANLLRAAKYHSADGRQTRDWSLFFFFRILSKAEVEATHSRWLDQNAASGAWREIRVGVTHPGLMSMRLDAPAQLHAPAADGDPAPQFLAWLKLLVTGKGGLFSPDPANGGPKPGPVIAGASPDAPVEQTFEALLKLLQKEGGSGDALIDVLRRLPSVVHSDDGASRAQALELFAAVAKSAGSKYLALLDQLGAALTTTEAADPDALAMLSLYEVLRQHAPAMVDELAGFAAVRSEATEAERGGPDVKVDATPISIAFSYAGLAALRMAGPTLASFPEAFKQGMAARAARLSDTGPSAPETWEGELGLPSVHGFFTGGFAKHKPRQAAFWKALRADIAAFNDPAGARGKMLRDWLAVLFHWLGMEIVHIELGQDPYEEKEGGTIETLRPRKEHFGFRDGLSQPFVDLRLGDPPGGGATPARLGGWTPVAPGEIFLDQKDENGEAHELPIHPTLRAGSTFLVFRKLEQDVQGFRAFFDLTGRDETAAEALAAQFVGRWPNGAPLVSAPRFAQTMSETELNDFRYAADDAEGRKCPLGAHVRRANPRDIGDRDGVRRHRILRRSLSYGGGLLAEGKAGDGERRGLLFIAANARIDLQFEVIQADWLNGGEFLGQAGLARCPLTGANDGAIADSFLEAGAAAPVTGLPRFVTTRGGEYFFAPGLAALTEMSKGARFEVAAKQMPLYGRSMADAVTPGLFSERRLTSYGGKLLMGAAPIEVATPPSDPLANDALPPVVFVGQHAHVERVVRDLEAEAGKLEFSVCPYQEASRRITRGEVMPIATDVAGPTAGQRQGMWKALNKAWYAQADTFGGEDGLKAEVVKAVQEGLELALRRATPPRRIDLIGDLATPACYAVLTRIFGTEGPNSLTELAGSLPFARPRVSDLPMDWLALLKGERPTNPALTTTQIWTTIVVADLIGNLESIGELQALSRQAGGEMLTHVDGLVARARAAFDRAAVRGRSAPGPATLLDAFVAIQDDPELTALYPDKDAYFRDVTLTLLEFMGSALAVIPLVFAKVMELLLDNRVDLPALMELLEPAKAPTDDRKIDLLIYEAERLNPSLPVRMRRCETTTELEKGVTIEAGRLVATLVSAANKDPRAFLGPDSFSLNETPPPAPATGDWPLNGPYRDRDKYLLFGVKNRPGLVSNKDCWGRDRVALPVLRECVRAAGRLQGLRRVAGPAGKPRKLAEVVIGLTARFTEVLPRPR